MCILEAAKHVLTFYFQVGNHWKGANIFLESKIQGSLSDMIHPHKIKQITKAQFTFVVQALFLYKSVELWEPGSRYCWRWQPGASLGDPEPDTRGHRGVRVSGRTGSKLGASWNYKLYKSQRVTFWSLICLFYNTQGGYHHICVCSKFSSQVVVWWRPPVQCFITDQREAWVSVSDIVVRHLLTRYLKFLSLN